MNILTARLQNPSFTPTQDADFHQWQFPTGFSLYGEGHGWSGDWWWCQAALKMQWATSGQSVGIEIYAHNADYGFTDSNAHIPAPARNTTGYVQVLRYPSGLGTPTVLYSAAVALSEDVAAALTLVSGVNRLSVLVAGIEAWGVDLAADEAPVTSETIRVSAMPAADSWLNALPASSRFDGHLPYVVDAVGAPYYLLYYYDGADNRPTPTAFDITSDLTFTDTAGAWPAEARLKAVYFTSSGVPGGPLIYYHGPDTLFVDPWRVDTIIFTGPPPAAGTSGNIVRCHDGKELVWRGPQLWWRPTCSSPWTTGAALADTTGGLLLLDPADSSVYALAPTLLTTHDRGVTTNTTPGAALPAPVTNWAAAGLTLTDARDFGDGYALAVGSGTGGLYCLGLQGATPTLIAADATGAPVLFRDSTGRVRAVVVAAGNVQEYTAGLSGMGTWTVETPQALGESVACASACAWEAHNGLRVVAGCDTAANTVRLVCSGGVGQAWQLGAFNVEVAAGVAPYVIETTSGGWEVGWLDGTGAWVRYASASPSGTWTEVSP